MGTLGAVKGIYRRRLDVSPFPPWVDRLGVPADMVRDAASVGFRS